MRLAAARVCAVRATAPVMGRRRILPAGAETLKMRLQQVRRPIRVNSAVALRDQPLCGCSSVLLRAHPAAASVPLTPPSSCSLHVPNSPNYWRRCTSSDAATSDSDDGEKRISIWDAERHRIIKGFAAPKRKNLDKYLEANPVRCDSPMHSLNRRITATNFGLS
eukprot:SAG11_NODE_15250_length_584_cov_0.637113_1_plen_163_part_01